MIFSESWLHECQWRSLNRPIFAKQITNNLEITFSSSSLLMVIFFLKKNETLVRLVSFPYPANILQFKHRN